MYPATAFGILSFTIAGSSSFIIESFDDLPVPPVGKNITDMLTSATSVFAAALCLLAQR
ncbi:MAG: hypothetical protein GQ564_13015 [Bacteroidales bacterium]|nr:hypothetical protein [Bacteroidales bacterium]